MQRIDVLAVQNILQILPILVFLQNLIYFQDIFPADPSVQIRDFFQTADLSMLVLFQRLYKVGGIHKAFVCTGIQPGKALSQKFDI